MTSSNRTFLKPSRRRWCPPHMSQPPYLNPATKAGPVKKQSALLVNPFYPKDPNASFGKHVLTPTLALTSFAATTPEHWEVQYWDENLLDRRPPFATIPEVVGITVHLTFANRAFELAGWYRSCGSKIVLGGLHVLSCLKSARRTQTHSPLEMVCSYGHASWRMSKRVVCNLNMLRPMKATIAWILHPDDPFFRARVFLPRRV